ncbi:hypothetical protein BJB45_03115 [Halomonas huangheensis]|uniref:DUF2254 domain-containing protein n=1 Tax=Halomonas huangheensis TaxID=1178482 RepID=W1N5B6_9GAMM|nr:hypothetical protein AR456_04600 [Halomonas huangheensis]ERL50130.1 hypothetical protein BJB45_03115 [Halomonas huangheensis]
MLVVISRKGRIMGLSLLFHPILLFKRFASSIAYLPTLAAIVYAALGVLALIPPVSSDFLPEALKQLGLASPGDAQPLLSALLAGMISLMVFSFSMVMSVLSQAGANFSHKLVFGLISERRHQWVLGHYLGTILFILMLLIVPHATDGDRLWRSAAVYSACLMVLHCLGLFVYFIHNVSQSIQIDAVISGLHAATLKSMQCRRDNEQGKQWQSLPVPDVSNASYHEIPAREAGYLQNADLSSMAKLAADSDAIVHLDFRFGDYVLEGQPILRLECAPVPDQQWRDDLCDCLIQLHGESVEEHFVYGMTQLMEVAIKALSPGINDPGTARLCLHRLTDLLSHYMREQPANCLTDSNGKVRVYWQIEPFESLVHRLLTPILHYGVEDQSILLGLLKAVKSLSLMANPSQLTTLQQVADRIIENLEQHSQHHLDRRFVSQRLKQGHHRLLLPAELKAP